VDERGTFEAWSAPVGGRAKRALDLAVSVPLTVALAPVMAGIALWVRRDSPGPALFRQTRIGHAGRPFTLLKFRSMVEGAQGMGPGLRVTSDDDRITRSGRVLRRLSLDELPQLINIVRGDMSLVGPRPTVAAQVERYTPRQRRRLMARPGVTGLAQVRGRNSIPWSRRIEYDVEYVDGWSMRRDLVILARTVLVVLGRGDTYNDAVPVFDLPERPPDEGPK
jgi:lipopolysaccharide/colanic/teichoic acid biosynthesis glycosyltransferase